MEREGRRGEVGEVEEARFGVGERRRGVRGRRGLGDVLEAEALELGEEGVAAGAAGRRRDVPELGALEALDAPGQDVDDKGNFYFLEVNKRIQVEHPITEEVTGVDLVKQQILVAMGEPLKLSQSDIKFTGHAIECRINAEDPWNEFRPSPGKIEMYYAPGGRGVRLDSHAYAGYTIPSHYDSMIAKLITYGTNRRDAMNKMNRALDEYIVTGIKTTIPFQKAILHDPEFCRGVYTTNFVEELLGGGRRELIQEKA